MAYAVSFDEYYDEASTYDGPCEHFECELTAIPGMRGTIKAAVEAWCWAEGATMLRFRLMQDTQPFFDKYKIDLWAHGSPAIPWVLLVGVIIGLGIAGFLWWIVTDENWYKKLPGLIKDIGLFLALGVGIAAVVILMGD